MNRSALILLVLLLFGGVAIAGTLKKSPPRRVGESTTVVTQVETDVFTVTLPSPAPTPTPTPNPTPTTGCHWILGGTLPDPNCTPGATNPDVTAATIGQTICVSGWTSTVRPPVSVTGPIKLDRMAVYGAPQPTSLYELDHLIPLELGGATQSLLNLWPEPRTVPQGKGFGAKDAVENRLRGEVCAGKITLHAAQQAIVADWRTAP